MTPAQLVVLLVVHRSERTFPRGDSGLELSGFHSRTVAALVREGLIALRGGGKERSVGSARYLALSPAGRAVASRAEASILRRGAEE